MVFPHAKLVDSAYLVTKSHHKLYDATSAATITLTGTLPTVSFRCRITISSVTGHTDCLGHVLINAEDINFLVATTKTSTILLTALPTVTTTGLDCHILIEAINSGGADIMVETLTVIDIKFKDETEYYSQAIGGFVTRPAHCTTDETASQVHDIIRYGGNDYEIKAIHTIDDRHGQEIKRKLEF
jgi:hypothetical protein